MSVKVFARKFARVSIWMLVLLAIALAQPLVWEYVVSSASSWLQVSSHSWQYALLTENPHYSPDSTKVMWTLHRPLTSDEKQWILDLDSTAVFIWSYDVSSWLKQNGWEQVQGQDTVGFHRGRRREEFERDAYYIYIMASGISRMHGLSTTGR